MPVPDVIATSLAPDMCFDACNPTRCWATEVLKNRQTKMKAAVKFRGIFFMVALFYVPKKQMMYNFIQFIRTMYNQGSLTHETQ